MEWNSRTEALLGPEAVERLKSASVALFGVGGVGSFAAEALVRAGVGRLLFVDGDTVAESNLNRQLIALRSTIGRPKAEVVRERALDINPDADVTALNMFYTAETAGAVDFSGYDYAADCIDMVSSKLLIAEKCRESGTRLISAMGAGNKLDPTAFRVCDVFETSGCPLARVMRRELRARGFDRLTVVFSPEEPAKPAAAADGRRVVGSVSYVPSSAGLALAGWIIGSIAGNAG